MSVQDGKKILAESKTHEDRLVLLTGAVFRELSTSLRRQKEIPPKSYAHALNLIKQIYQSPAIYLHRTFNECARDRSVEFMTVGLFPTKSDPNQYVPCVNWLSLGPCHLYTGLRELPISINSEGLEFRHLKHDATLLEYGDPDFARMILTAAILCKDKMLPPDSESCINVPLNSGVVYGYAHSPKREDVREFVGIGCLFNPKKKCTYVEKTPWFKNDQWGLKINLTSYFGTMNLHPYQQGLHHAYQSLNVARINPKAALEDLAYVLTAVAPPDAERVQRLKLLGQDISHLSFIG